MYFISEDYLNELTRAKIELKVQRVLYEKAMGSQKEHSKVNKRQRACRHLWCDANYVNTVMHYSLDIVHRHYACIWNCGTLANESVREIEK